MQSYCPWQLGGGAGGVVEMRLSVFFVEFFTPESSNLQCPTFNLERLFQILGGIFIHGFSRKKPKLGVGIVSAGTHMLGGNSSFI